MNKSILTYLAQALDQYRADRAASAGEATPQKPGRVRAFLRWLTPNGGTLLLIALLVLTQNVWAWRTQAPAAPGPSATTVNYQGRLADSDGNPLDGVYGMTFALYDAPTGGNPIWTESHTAVTVSDGLFSVGLGSQTPGGIPTSVWDGDRYLEVTVGGETLSPRELIRSVPIAGMALTVPDGSITEEKLSRTFSYITMLSEKVTLLYEHSAGDGVYHDLDMSDFVPADATAVILQVGVKSSPDASYGAVEIIPPGTYQWDYFSTRSSVGNAWYFNQGMVKTENATIRYRASTGLAEYYIMLVGYVE